ncbi:MerR family redox-sensitive transcriptional activator SoxR [Sinobacterium caligoides]|uniref:Redox-sensitive transcriptional activator SoxR n=1 Tax=Sinobacterium caligoides TaxID=933926 RepID=A0A3N2E050_9GAMM|nr:redox-sensitive transcriptional activator SoxR [Sinobacterium caligoides]ROS05483.1 MerR family redox-sensitive transcriptional activator SoxR [Sinobacterium caligoides]
MAKNAKLLTVGETAERSGVAASALRFYESKSLIKSLRTTGNQRRYHPAMLRRIALIQVAQLVGFTLEEIGYELAELPLDRPPSQQDWNIIARKWEHDLEQRMLLIEKLKDNLSGCIGCGCLSLKKCQLLNPEDTVGHQGQGPRRILNTHKA